ncbi:MAG TPA: hypothetical protein VJS37_08710 [Terriglobales bacterium]|jgi:hypothetical protein|nr:hypothetical protein [Terriglobales bacterium]
MAVIHVPRPSRKAMNPHRPISSLLLTQIGHLQHAERRLPLRYRTKIYTHAIRTEAEAAAYIYEVTEAIHQAHADAADKRAARPKGKGGRKIVARAGKPKRKGGKKVAPSKKRKRSTKKK